jgi:hypothetical protein
MTWRATSGKWPWLWGVIGLVTLTSPVLIMLFYPMLRSSGDESDSGGGGKGPGDPYAYEELDAPVVMMGEGAGGLGAGSGVGSYLTEDSELEPLEPVPLISHGRAVQVDPIKSTLKAPGTKCLKRKCHELLSNFAFNFQLRRYNTGGRCHRRCTSTQAVPRSGRLARRPR